MKNRKTNFHKLDAGRKKRMRRTRAEIAEERARKLAVVCVQQKAAYDRAFAAGRDAAAKALEDDTQQRRLDARIRVAFAFAEGMKEFTAAARAFFQEGMI